MRADRRRTIVPYEDIVLRTKPVLYFPMQGQLPRELVLNKTVNISATPPTVVPGPFGGAEGRLFSSSTSDNDRLDVADDTSYHPGDVFSVGGWYVTLGGASQNTILYLGSSDINLYMYNTDPILARSGYGNVYSVTGPTSGGWHHMLFTKNGSGASNTCTVYLDGLLTAGTYTNRTITAASSLPMFGVENTGNDFYGSLSHWAIWNRVLTAGEVRELYTAGGRR